MLDGDLRHRDRRRIAVPQDRMNGAEPLVAQETDGPDAEHVLKGAVQPAARYAKGGNVTEIAKELGRSVKTISAQKCAAMRKLDLSTDAELYRFAFDSGLVKTRPSRI